MSGMMGAEVVEQIRVKYELFIPYLNEQTRRVWAAIEARSLGYGGISAYSVDRKLIQKGANRWL
jgi:hypothetical protein